MKSLTKNIGKSHAEGKLNQNFVVKRVLISRPNHRLGNILLLTPLVQEIEKTFPNAKIDLFVKGGITPIIFKNYKSVDKIFQLPKKPFSNLFQYIKGWFSLKSNKYDLAINATQGSSSGRLSISFAKADYKFFGEDVEDLKIQHSDYNHIAKNTIYNLRNYLSQIGLEDHRSQVPFLDLRLDKEELEDGKKKLHDLVKNDKKTICLFTNATGDKCYSESWWTAFYDKLESAFPDYNIIELLPVENISKLNFNIPNFYSKDVREMGGFIANCAIFIAADNGVMHLASASGTPTIGLFSVTNETMYKPYNHKSLSINTNNVDNDKVIELIKSSLN
ncbi:hypothetical protein GCM10007332_03040 [Epilithonimonas arachidiradicis]|nr:hypothetical protein GCM10007332_03040 [Epilithonimonas arachidiradicis]